jgi:hypothetical protein
VDTVSATELAKRIIELLGLKHGDMFDIAITRDGHVLLGRAEANQHSVEQERQ